MSKKRVDNDSPVRCPICGSIVEFGCIPGPARGGSGLRWRAGGPGIHGEVVTCFGGVLALGQIGLFGAVPFMATVSIVAGLVLPVLLWLAYPALKRYGDARWRGGRERDRSRPRGDV